MPKEEKKKTSPKKSEEKKVVVKETPKVAARSGRLRSNRVISARDYLVRVGTKPNHIPALVAAAKSKGHTVETVASWKAIFERI